MTNRVFVENFEMLTISLTVWRHPGTLTWCFIKFSKKRSVKIPLNRFFTLQITQLEARQSRSSLIVNVISHYFPLRAPFSTEEMDCVVIRARTFFPCAHRGRRFVFHIENPSFSIRLRPATCQFCFTFRPWCSIIYVAVIRPPSWIWSRL